MHVLMVTGSFPPDVCGVGDYAYRLTQALVEQGVEVTIIDKARLTAGPYRSVLEDLQRIRYDILHIQYPSVGYGKSLFPQLLSLKMPAIVTLHEFSQVRLARKLASISFLLSARHLLFTSEIEMNWVGRFFPQIMAKSSVIPIGSNILPVGESYIRRRDEVVYFGLISPRKGIEEVLKFAAIGHRLNTHIKVRIIGSVPEPFRRYAARMIERSRDLPIIWTLDKSESEVAKLLAESAVAYLPFPDGASERRGSLKVILSAGVVCISTEGRRLPEPLRRQLVIARDGEEAFAKAVALLADQQRCDLLSSASVDYAKSFSWEHIARRHIQIYQAMR